MFEFIGETITNSASILYDSIHDLGDALSIDISCFLEIKSKKKPDKNYTFEYIRYSVFGSVITTSILVFSSIFAIIAFIKRIFNPVNINYNGMIILAIVGVILKFVAALKTREGDSLNKSQLIYIC